MLYNTPSKQYLDCNAVQQHTIKTNQPLFFIFYLSTTSKQSDFVLDDDAWNDNNYEGKALRRVFTILLKLFEKEITNDTTNLDSLQKITHIH